MNGSPATILGIVIAPEGLVCCGQVGVIHGLGAIHRDGFADVFNRQRRLAALLAQNAQQVQCVGVPRIESQNLLVDLFGLQQVAGVVKRQALLQYIGIPCHVSSLTVGRTPSPPDNRERNLT